MNVPNAPDCTQNDGRGGSLTLTWRRHFRGAHCVPGMRLSAPARHTVVSQRQVRWASWREKRAPGTTPGAPAERRKGANGTRGPSALSGVGAEALQAARPDHNPAPPPTGADSVTSPSRCLGSFPFPFRKGAAGERGFRWWGTCQGRFPRKGCDVSTGPRRSVARRSIFPSVWKELRHLGETGWEKVILQIFKSNFVKPWALIHLP